MISLNTLNVIPLIAFILYTIILVIIQTSQTTRLSRTFSLYIVAMMIWSLGSFLMKTNVPPSSLFWNKFMQIGFVSVPVLLLRFSYHLTDDTHKRTLVNLGYVLIVFMLILTYTNNVISSVDYNDGSLTYESSWGAYVVAVLGMTYSLIALGIIVKKTITQEVSFHKTGLVLIGLFLVVLGGTLNISPTIGKYGFDILLNTVNAFLITYAIYRNKFLEINILVKKGLSISLSNLVMFLIYSAVIISVYNFILSKNNNIGTLSILLLMLPIYLILEVIRSFINRVVAVLFFRGAKDRQIILKEYSDLVNSRLDLDHVTNSLVKAIEKAVAAKDVHLFLKNTSKYYLQSSTGIVEYSKSTVTFKLNHPIIKWFEKGEKILLKTNLDKHVSFKGLWDAERDVLSWLSTELIVPIRYLDTIIGFIVMSEKKDSTPYSMEEISFLETIINNAAAIIENSKSVELMKKQSITDELTRFYNHRYFQESVNNWIKNKKFVRFGLALIDIDQFRIYNDLYGHSSGDVVLKRISEIIRTTTTKNDLLVRFGGEEFVVVFPELVPEKVFEIANMIRHNVEQAFLMSDDIREFLTVTIGISNYDIDGNNLDDLINKADKAVLFGKQSGRNKTIMYSKKMDVSDEDSVQSKIKDAFVSSIYALAATIDAKDHYTYGHSNNVAVIAEAIAKKAGVDEAGVETIKNAGLLHDIGKVGIPESVLSKPGLLNEEEYEIMKGHVLQSVNIIRHIPNLVDTIPIVISHHERYDGNGYPRGIKGDNIPYFGRILTIADSFDAMTTDRPYRKGLSLEQAIYELRKNAGKQFDPNLIEIFIEIIKSGEIYHLQLENRPSFNG